MLNEQSDYPVTLVSVRLIVDVFVVDMRCSVFFSENPVKLKKSLDPAPNVST